MEQTNRSGNARETAYRILRDKIIHLELRPGEALSDKALAEELGMSRTPVREALIILTTTNMVLLRPQIGTFVAPIDLGRMDMEQFARYTMEKEIISLACGAVTEELRWRYEENLRSYGHYAETPGEGTARRLLELDNAFHRIAFEAVGRERNYYHMLEGMLHIERLRALALEDNAQETNLTDHRAISEAILAADRPRAQAALEQHLRRYQDSIPAIRAKYPEYFTMG